MTINTAKAHVDSSQPHVPKPITLEEACEADTQRRNVENMQSQAPASDVSEATPTPPAIPTSVCNLCQSSPFEAPEDKAARYTAKELKLHESSHHNDKATFDTWLIFHFKSATCHYCPICRTIETFVHRMCLHLLEQHHDHVPEKLPAEIFTLAYRICSRSSARTVKAVALKHRDMAERLGNKVEPASKTKARARIRKRQKLGGVEGSGQREGGVE